MVEGVGGRVVSNFRHVSSVGGFSVNYMVWKEVYNYMYVSALTCFGDKNIFRIVG